MSRLWQRARAHGFNELVWRPPLEEGAKGRGHLQSAICHLLFPSYSPPSVTALDHGPHPMALWACTVTDQFGIKSTLK